MLANFFIRQGRIEEALDLCDVAASAGLVEEVAALAVSALEMHGSASPPQFERVHKLLGDALLKQPASLALLTKMALLHNLNGAGATIIMITHDADLAAQLPRQIRVLDGEVVADTVTAAAP